MYYLCHKSVSFNECGCIPEHLFSDPEIVSSFCSFEQAVFDLSNFRSWSCKQGSCFVGEAFWISDESGSVLARAEELIDI